MGGGAGLEPDFGQAIGGAEVGVFADVAVVVPDEAALESGGEGGEDGEGEDAGPEEQVFGGLGVVGGVEDELVGIIRGRAVIGREGVGHCGEREVIRK